MASYGSRSRYEKGAKCMFWGSRSSLTQLLRSSFQGQEYGPDTSEVHLKKRVVRACHQELKAVFINQQRYLPPLTALPMEPVFSPDIDLKYIFYKHFMLIVT